MNRWVSALFVSTPCLLFAAVTPDPDAVDAAARAFLQLTKRYEAAVRVCQSNSRSRNNRARNVGNILEEEKRIKAQLESAAIPTAGP